MEILKNKNGNVIKIKTPHVMINPEDKTEIAKVVVMPGDPLRAKHFAKTYLKNVKQWNGIRGNFGYTGEYNGKLVSVLASGMGIGSIGIYAFELYKFCGVELIIRMGSCGSYSKDLKVLTTVIAKDAFLPGGGFDLEFTGNKTKVAICPEQDLNTALNIIKTKSKHNVIPVHAHSSNVFYSQLSTPPWELYAKEGIHLDVVEMESHALFLIAKFLNKHALGLFAVSDNLITHEATTPEQRENGLKELFDVTILVASNFN